MLSKKSEKLKNKTGVFPCEICKNPNILHIHHIEGREIPNAEHKFNLVSLCPNCHYGVHYGMIVIEKWVMTSNGRELIWHKKDENSFTGEDAKPPLLI
jgi:hypothetical protein